VGNFVGGGGGVLFGLLPEGVFCYEKFNLGCRVSGAQCTGTRYPEQPLRGGGGRCQCQRLTLLAPTGSIYCPRLLWFIALLCYTLQALADHSESAP